MKEREGRTLLQVAFSGEAQGGAKVMQTTMTTTMMHDVVILHCQDGNKFLRTQFVAARHDGQVS